MPGLNWKTPITCLLLSALTFVGCSDASYQSRQALDSQVANALQRAVTEPIPPGTLSAALDQLATDFDVAIEFADTTPENDAASPLAHLRQAEVELQITGIPLDHALSLLLRPVGCDYQVDGDRIVVDIERFVERSIVTRSYHVADLLGRGPVLRVSAGMSAPHPRYLTFAANFVAIDSAWLVQAIKQLAGGDVSWSVGKIESLEETLLISHTEQTHRRIEDILSLMRKLSRTAAVDALMLPGKTALAAEDLETALQQRIDWKLPAACSVEQLVEKFRSDFGLKILLDRPSFASLERDVQRQERWLQHFSTQPLTNAALGDVIDLVFRLCQCDVFKRGDVIVIAGQGLNNWPSEELFLKAYPAPWATENPGDLNESNHPDLAHLAELEAVSRNGAALVVPGGLIALSSHAGHRELSQAFTQLRRSLDVTDMAYDERPPNPVTRALSDKLAQIVDLEFDEVPLSEALAQIQQEYEIDNLVIDWHLLSEPFRATLSLNGRARSLAATTTVDLHGLSLRAAINQMLLSAHADFPDARVTIRDNLVVIQQAKDSLGDPREWRLFRAGGHPGLFNEDLVEAYQRLTTSGCGWRDEGTGAGTIVPFAHGVAIAQPEGRFQETTRLWDLGQALSDPANTHQPVLYANSRTPAEKAVISALRQRVNFAVAKDYTLAGLAERLRREFGINVVINWRSLIANTTWQQEIDHSFHPQTSPVAFEFHDLTLSEILDYLLASFHCRHVIRDEALMIVELEDVEEFSLETRAYPLAWLRPDDLREVNRVLEVVDGMYFDLLGDWISEGWLNDGMGAGIVESSAGGLLITQTAPMHRGLESILRDIAQIQLQELDATRPNPSRATLLRQLEEPVSVDFDGVPLSEALRQLQAEHSIPNIFFDWEALRETNLFSESLRTRLLNAPVTVRLNDITLRTAIEQVVADAIDHLYEGVEGAIGYLVRDSDGYESYDDSEGYPIIALRVGDRSLLVTSAFESCLTPYVYALDAETIQAAGGMDAFVYALIGTVGDNWLDEGTGPGTLVDIDHLLVVSQTPSVHAQIRTFIELLKTHDTSRPLQGQLLGNSSANDAIVDALDKRLTLTIDNEPVEQAFAKLAQAAGIPNAVVSENSLRTIDVEAKATLVSLDLKNDRFSDALDMLVCQVIGTVDGERPTADWTYHDGCLVLMSWRDALHVETYGETRVYRLPGDAPSLTPELESKLMATVENGWRNDGSGSYFQSGPFTLVFQQPQHHKKIAGWFQSLDPETQIAPGLVDRRLTRRQEEIRAALLEPIGLSLPSMSPADAVADILRAIEVESFFPVEAFPIDLENVDVNVTSAPRIDVLRQVLPDESWQVEMVGERVWIFPGYTQTSGLLGAFRRRLGVLIDPDLFVPLDEPKPQEQVP